MMQEAIDIPGLIPHTGKMCLLDSVQRWDEAGIICGSTSHRDPENPLCEGGVLRTIALVEYGAQAAAVHAGLALTGLGGDRRTALIGAIKALTLHRQIVEPGIAMLEISATSVYQTNDGAIYQIAISGDGEMLAEGRVVLLLPAAG